MPASLSKNGALRAGAAPHSGTAFVLTRLALFLSRFSQYLHEPSCLTQRPTTCLPQSRGQQRARRAAGISLAVAIYFPSEVEATRSSLGSRVSILEGSPAPSDWLGRAIAEPRGSASAEGSWNSADGRRPENE